MERGIIAWFSELTKDDIALAGGKGANLGTLYNLKLPVPPGFVVSAQAYKYFLEKTGIQKKILSIINNLDVENNEQLQEAARDIQEIILDAQMPQEIKKLIIEAYDDMNVDMAVNKVIGNDTLNSIIKAGREHPFVAVRSSATAEDLPSISEDEYVFVKLNDKPFFDKIKYLAEIIKSKDELYVPAMNNFNIEWKKVSNLYKHKVEAKSLFKITTDTGREITISPNHTLITLDENNLEPRITEISNLKSGEKLPIIKFIPNLETVNSINVLDYISKEGIYENENKLMIKNNSNNWRIQQPLISNIKITKNFAYLLGVYCAEGTTYRNNQFIITNSNKIIIKRIKEAITELEINSNNKINKHSLRPYCKTFVRLLNENCGMPDKNMKGKGKICKTKQVPEFIFSCSKEIIGEFLKGCFDGEGTVDKVVSYSSTSNKLISGMAILFELLGIEFYIKRRDETKSFNLSLPSRELLKFQENIGFLHEKKQQKLKKLLRDYENALRHFEFKNSFSVSKELSNNIREIIESKLKEEDVIIQICKLCFNNLEKSSNYKGHKRYYCKTCKKSFYLDNIINKTIKKYINYNNQGRFLKNSVPWNKSINTYENYGLSKFREKLTNSGAIELTKIFTESLLWDKITKIEEIYYNSFVYDFTVPGVENFAAGLGSIITHNSASFAGQQETYLNVKGKEEVILSVQKCWASLFTARAIYYRQKNNFSTEDVLIAVVIQKMVNSEKAGVMFSINPSTNNETEIMIEAALGLGEVVVGGQITPDTYIVDKQTMSIKSKKIATQTFGLFRDKYTGKNVKRNLNYDEGSKQKLTEQEILQLAEYGKKIEDSYGKPMDMEWATENSRVYIVQARPVTTMKRKTETTKAQTTGEEILNGLAASPGIGCGKVKIVNNVDELTKIEKGDVLVTKMTSPDYVPGMKKAVAIVTDEGGLTSHASIVSRELGIPCIVGTEKATQILHENQLITVDGTNGKVYFGETKIEQQKEQTIQNEENTNELITGTKIYMNLGEPEKIDEYKKLPFDGIGLMRIEFIITDYVKKHPMYMIQQGQQQEYINKLAEGIEKVAKTINPKPVIVRFSDFKTNEYKNLEGGSQYEPHEENPMIGWRGVSRYISEDFKEAFRLELKAIKKCREQGLRNVHVMLPFVRNTEEVRKCLEILKSEGLEKTNDFGIYLMAEVPAISIIPEEFAELPITGASIGSNDLTQGVLCVDRDNSKLGRMGYFDERNPAVLKAMSNIIRGFKKFGKTVGICGQCPSEYPEIVEFLVKEGITSISVSPDVVNKVRKQVASVERNILLGKIRGY